MSSVRWEMCVKYRQVLVKRFWGFLVNWGLQRAQVGVGFAQFSFPTRNSS